MTLLLYQTVFKLLYKYIRNHNTFLFMLGNVMSKQSTFLNSKKDYNIYKTEYKEKKRRKGLNKTLNSPIYDFT